MGRVCHVSTAFLGVHFSRISHASAPTGCSSQCPVLLSWYSAIRRRMSIPVFTGSATDIGPCDKVPGCEKTPHYPGNGNDMNPTAVVLADGSVKMLWRSICYPCKGQRYVQCCVQLQQSSALFHHATFWIHLCVAPCLYQHHTYASAFVCLMCAVPVAHALTSTARLQHDVTVP